MGIRRGTEFGYLDSAELLYFMPSAKAANIPDPKFPDYAPNKFWCSSAVTVSRIHQAKGNEADVVYIIGLDMVAKHEAEVAYRNQIFVALTRSRGWVHISGCGDPALYLPKVCGAKA